MKEVEFSSRRKERRDPKNERRKSFSYLEKDRRKDDRRNREQRKIDRRRRKELERHKKAQR